MTQLTPVLGTEEVPCLICRRAVGHDERVGISHADVPGNGLQQNGQPPHAVRALQNIQRDRRRNGAPQP